MKFTTPVVLLALALSSAVRAQACRSDLNGDGQVNGADLAMVLSDWGLCPATISSVSPAHGGTQGGTVISITGTGLHTTTQVRVGGVSCTNVTVLTPTLVRATTPPGQPGEVSVAVTTIGSTTLASTPFTYVQQQITSVVPSSGPYVGGTPITINGQFLSGATAITVGGVPCTNVVSVGSTQVTAVTPAGSVGAVDVVVTCAKGTVTEPDGFSYLPLIIPSWATLIEALPDPAVVTDPALRAAITGSGFAWRVRDTATQIEMLLVPPGTFQMGCSPSALHACNAMEVPTHPVTLTRAFYLGRSEVTQAQYAAATGSNPSYFQAANGFPGSDLRPVDQVSWNMASLFAASMGSRLPTEAEWEYACRAGTSAAFCNGTNDDSTVGSFAWFAANSGGQTHPVAQLAGNRLGFHDMLGNVWEWVNDWYAPYPADAVTDPLGPASGSGKCLRGSTWAGSSTSEFRSSYRGWESPALADYGRGFRVARNP